MMVKTTFSAFEHVNTTLIKEKFSNEEQRNKSKAFCENFTTYGIYLNNCLPHKMMIIQFQRNVNFFPKNKKFYFYSRVALGSH